LKSTRGFFWKVRVHHFLTFGNIETIFRWCSCLEKIFEKFLGFFKVREENLWVLVISKEYLVVVLYLRKIFEKHSRVYLKVRVHHFLTYGNIETIPWYFFRKDLWKVLRVFQSKGRISLSLYLVVALYLGNTFEKHSRVFF